jgi:uncharacterized membrane protein
MWHLFHPAFLHFSVAFLVAGGAAEAWGLVGRREAPRRLGATLLLLGLVSLVPTIASGYLAANTLGLPVDGGLLLDSHERNGWILLGLLVGSQFWKAWFRGELPARHRPFYVVLLVAIVLLTAYSAWLGGRMVYGQGYGVL